MCNSSDLVIHSSLFTRLQISVGLCSLLSRPLLLKETSTRGRRFVSECPALKQRGLSLVAAFACLIAATFQQKARVVIGSLLRFCKELSSVVLRFLSLLPA